MQIGCLLLAICTSATVAAPASAHFDVMPYLTDSGDLRAGGYQLNALPYARTDQQVFIGSLLHYVSFPGAVDSSAPGWIAVTSAVDLPAGSSPLPGSTAIYCDFVSMPQLDANLAYWDGLGAVAFGATPDGEALQLSLGGAESATVSGENEDVVGIEIATTSALGGLHVHPFWTLYGNSLLDPTSMDAPSSGVYLASVTMRIDSIRVSNPVYVLLGLDVSTDQLLAAESWVSSQLSVPEPATGGLAICTAPIVVAFLRRRLSQIKSGRQPA